MSHNELDSVGCCPYTFLIHMLRSIINYNGVRGLEKLLKTNEGISLFLCNYICIWYFMNILFE